MGPSIPPSGESGCSEGAKTKRGTIWLLHSLLLTKVLCCIVSGPPGPSLNPLTVDRSPPAADWLLFSHTAELP
ncbi:hypothetical protein BDQ94DRAFT_133491 [Aspergillus welwitschiae]|uniref:Uncharacterized protein n=1 Tax=Aspergillus welwitschiae TaxID=1341132 RepID=A0A3F3QK74_9EURO|nr:hypothetical protein BDQ94DRAFT_133491 [Aspergillus welwitschiae]RDH39683.1 hypothetical protein BDQ94DRAFT_133491 [Aspergillus welwitschiae]